MKTGIIIFIITQSLFAAPPPLSRTAREVGRSESEVVTDDVDRLKDEVVNKKNQMLLFRQLLKTEAIESTFPRVFIDHVNEMGGRYKIYSLVYYIDKEKVFGYYLEENSTNRQNFDKETTIFKGPVAPGQHEINVEVIYQGNDTGIFNYINDYKIPVQAKKTFKVEKGQNIEIRVVAFEKGWALTDFKDRPDLSIKLSNANLTGSQKAKDIK